MLPEEVRKYFQKFWRLKEKYNLNIRLKPVGCVGVCNQTPLMEIVTKDEIHSRYTNVSKHRLRRFF